MSVTDISIAAWVHACGEKLALFAARRHDLYSVVHAAAQVLVIRLAGAALAYASMILLARWLGTFEFGIYAYVWVWILLLGIIVPLGFSSAALRFVPDYLAREKWRRLRGFLKQSYMVVAVVGTLVALIGAGLVFVLRDIIEPYYFVPFLIGLVCVPFSGLLGHLQATARAFGWVRLAYTPDYVVRPLVFIAIMAWLILAGVTPDATDALWAVVAACLAAALIQSVFVLRRILRRLPATRSVYHTRYWAAVSVPFVMIEGFNLLLQNSDVLMIGTLLEPRDVAVYYAAIRTGSLIAFVYFAVSALAVPKFSKIYATGTPEEMQKFVTGIIQLMFWPSVLAAIVLTFLGSFALSLFGNDFAQGYPVLLVVLVGLLVRAATGPVGYLLNMTGHHMDTMRVYGIMTVINIMLNLLLIPQLGIVGAALSTSATIIVTNIWLYFLVRRRIGVSSFVFPLRQDVGRKWRSDCRQMELIG